MNECTHADRLHVDLRAHVRVRERMGLFVWPKKQKDGIVLLGMALANASGFKTWQQLDQLAAATSVRKFANEFNGTTFMQTGRCSSYANVIHQYVRAL